MSRPEARVTLTDRKIDKQKPAPKGARLAIFDTDAPGLALRVTDKGAKSFCVVTRFFDAAQQKTVQRWVTLGAYGEVSLAEAREKARDARAKAKRGEDPTPAPPPPPPPAPDSFAEAAANFLTRYVNKERGLRSAGEIERILNLHVIPVLGKRPITQIRRREVADLLDKIQDKSGPVMADRVLAIIRKLFNWYATRDDDFVSPIVKGMAKTKPSERARDRTLTDDEIRTLWPALSGTFGAFCKVLLLTTARREKVATLRWQDIGEDGVWTIPTEPREKNNPRYLPLPRAALDIIEAQPKIKDCPYVFAGRTRGPLRGYSDAKEKLDELAPLPNWRLHDLRRTGRTLLSRIGIASNIAEITLGHKIPGVEGVYDRHLYLEEKGDALNKLAGEIKLILNPPTGNVSRFRKRA